MNPYEHEALRYTGQEQITLERHDGGLKPAIGVNSFQVLRSNREHPEECKAPGWTYNHAPMLAYFNGKFYIEYLSNPFGEHRPPGRTLLATSMDGRNWTQPTVVFPAYSIPDGVFQYDNGTLPNGSEAVMHQRMGFYASSNGRLLVLGNYGISPTVHQVPFGPFSIGRVVREIFKDDSLGPIYFIRHNVGTVWNETNTAFPLFNRSADRQFVQACEELLASPLHTQQWAEEQGDADELITIKAADEGAFHNKAFCWYRLADQTIVGLWKWMKCAFSRDNGRTWTAVVDTPTIRHAGAKIWGQRTSDDRYALVYNPHTCNTLRWPLAIITGDDGLRFDKMMQVIGDLGPKRYDGGPYKSLGFSYVRGLEVGVDAIPDGAMFVAYSVNKEDIWISRIPVPVRDCEEGDISEHFQTMQVSSWIPGWNIYSPKWAPVEIVAAPQRPGNCLRLSDFDPLDYARAERIFRKGNRIQCTIDILCEQNDHGCLYIELWDASGNGSFAVIFGMHGQIEIIHGRRRIHAAPYEPGRWYQLKLVADARQAIFDVVLDGRSLGSCQQYQGQSSAMQGWFFAGTATSLERIVFRTGPYRRPAVADDQVNQAHDIDGAGEKVARADFYIGKLDVISNLI
jgi:hypothetical protein